MRGALDFSSWQGVVSTLLGLVVVSLVAVGIRLLVMQRVQRRRERENRQINERLKTLIAAYKTLGGSFTGDLTVDPRHLRELRSRPSAAGGSTIDSPSPGIAPEADAAHERAGGERRRRVRDAVEAALADVVLLGTEEQVRLAVRAAGEMVAGRSVEIAELVVSLRTFIRAALDLEPVPAELVIPRQGPLRTAGAARGGGGGGDRAGARGGGGGGGGMGGGAGAGAGIGVGVGLGGAGLHHAGVGDADGDDPIGR